MTNIKNSFILYTNYFDILKDLSDEDAGILFKAILEYTATDNISNLPKHLDLAFKFIRNQLEIDNDKYNNFLEKQKANGLKGGRPKKTETQKNPKNPSLFLKTQKSLNDNDNVNDNVNDNDNDIEEVVVEEEINKEEEEIEKAKKAADFYGEFGNVYLSKKNHDKLETEIMNNAVMAEIIQELSEKIVTNPERFKRYDEKNPDNHFMVLRNFWRYRKEHPEKFIKVLDGGRPRYDPTKLPKYNPNL